MSLAFAFSGGLLTGLHPHAADLLEFLVLDCFLGSFFLSALWGSFAPARNRWQGQEQRRGSWTDLREKGFDAGVWWIGGPARVKRKGAVTHNAARCLGISVQEAGPDCYNRATEGRAFALRGSGPPHAEDHTQALVAGPAGQAFRRGPERVAAGGGDGARRVQPDPGRAGVGQDAGHHVPRGLPDRPGRSGRLDLAGHLHPPRRAGDGAAAGHPDRPRRGQGLGRDVSPRRATACSAGRPSCWATSPTSRSSTAKTSST